MTLLYFHTTTFSTPVAAYLYFNVVQTHCFSIVCSLIDICVVLLCSAPSSLLCLPLACWYLRPCVFSAVPVPPPPGVNIEEHIQIRQEEKRQRINRRHRLEEGRGTDQGARGYILGLYRFCFNES